MPRRTSVLFFCDLDVVLSNLDGSVEVIYYHNFLELFCYICYNNTGDTNNPQFSYSPFFTLRATWSFCCNSLARSFYINKKEPDRSLTLIQSSLQFRPRFRTDNAIHQQTMLRLEVPHSIPRFQTENSVHRKAITAFVEQRLTVRNVLTAIAVFNLSVRCGNC